MSRGFFDAASGQPLHPAAQHALEAFAERSWADPNAPHFEGRRARQLLDASRETVSRVLRVEPSSVVFRHSGSDVAQEAILGVAGGQIHAGSSRCVVASAVERQVVFDAAHQVTDAELIRIPVRPTGAIELADFEAAISGRPTLACVQAANGEIGTRQPLAAVSSMCAGQRVPLVVDANGALGFDEPPQDWTALFADSMGWGGPRDIAILAVQPAARWRSPASNHADTRPVDVTDIAGAAAAAAALDAVEAQRVTESARLSALVAKIRTVVLDQIPDVEVVGDPIDRLPNVVTFSCLYVDGQVVADELDRLGLAVGSGSACASGTGLASHVLSAIGTLTHGNVRLSLPLGCPPEDVDRLLAVLPDVVARNRESLGVTDA